MLHPIRCKAQVLRRPLLQGALWTTTVVVRKVLGQDLLKMTASEDEESVQTLSADGADEALGEGVRKRGSNRGLDDPDALGAEHFIEAVGELRVPVTDEELDRSWTLGQDEIRLRVCWVTHAPTGLAVTPERWTRRVSISMKNNTERRRKSIVSTVKKSHASIVVACARRNSAQVAPVRLGVGSMPCRRRIAQTLEQASRTLMVASSPWMRRYPQVGFSFASRTTRCTVPTGKADRPGRRCG
jgi:hypothetical protein